MAERTEREHIFFRRKVLQGNIFIFVLATVFFGRFLGNCSQKRCFFHWFFLFKFNEIIMCKFIFNKNFTKIFKHGIKFRLTIERNMQLTKLLVWRCFVLPFIWNTLNASTIIQKVIVGHLYAMRERLFQVWSCSSLYSDAISKIEITCSL